MTLNEARTLANINARAQSLWQDGYTVERWRTEPDRYWVRTPNRTEYLVNSRTGFCGCPCYEERGVCKHSLAVLALRKEEDALEAEYALLAGAECASFGCDRYAEF